MAYNAIAQIDHDVVSNASDFDISDVRPAVPAHHEFPAHRTTLESPVEAAKTVGESASAGRLGSFIHSITSNSYEIIDDDDYDVADPKVLSSNANARQTERSSAGFEHDPSRQSSHSNTPLPHSSSPKPLVRTSSGSAIDLCHPTPDLQSLQGAYVGNIERLEKSAERLSMTSSDLGLELRKLDLEQKRRPSASSGNQVPESPTRQFSTGPVSNSIIGVNTAARTGGYSPGGFITSPRGSILSGSRLRSTSVNSRLAEVLEPEHEEDQDNVIPTNGQVPRLANPPPAPSQHQHREGVPILSLVEPIFSEMMEPHQEFPDRPATARSTDTYQQATSLFLDFDGVHFVPHPREPSLSRQLPLSKPHLASNAQYYEEPQEGQDLVYYPAPIPKVLNLPQRLSKRPPVSDHEKRRTKLLNAITASDKKGTETNDHKPNKGISNIPPHLRASVFFDQPSSSLDIQVKDQSAVITLDSILDASAHAPVTAFTDHPIVGHVGREVYGKAGKKPSSKDLAEKRRKHALRSTLTLRHSTMYPDSTLRVPSGETHGHSDLEAAEAAPLRASTYGAEPEAEGSSASDRDAYDKFHSSDEGDPENEDEEEEEDDSNGEDEPEEEEPILFGRPTTLLAELEMRKHEQKQRNRTAATAFPNGMHSTLLELDAVAQAQSNTRRHKHITLAWEAPLSHGVDAEDDEDIPLGVLFASKNPVLNERRPLGLMEKRELEDNEPLSKRRARLRGEAPPDPAPVKRASTMVHPQTPAAAQSDSGDEEETLAQRLRRLKAEKGGQTKSVLSADFANEIMAELSRLGDSPRKEKDLQPQAKEEEEEETLAQRRKRLQAEAKTRRPENGPNLKARRSMGEILQAYPSPNVHARKSSMGHFHAHRASIHQDLTYPNPMSTMYTLPPSMTYSAGFPQYPGYGMPHAYGNRLYDNSFIHNGQVGMNGIGYNMPYGHRGHMAQPSVDPKQREFIDRWRQSVLR